MRRKTGGGGGRWWGERKNGRTYLTWLSPPPLLSLTGGYGLGVIQVLEWAVDCVLSNKGYSHSGSVHRFGASLDGDEGEGDGEVEGAEEGEESEIEDEVEGGEEIEGGGWGGAEEEPDKWGSGRERDMVVSTLDSIEWRAELERVGPRLKVGRIGRDSTWQGRIKSMAELGE